jgi:hypothetical protein
MVVGDRMTRMTLWTIYDHPIDYPDFYVAREFKIGAGTHRPTTNVLLSTDLDELHGIMERMNLTAIPRDPSDDPVIVEVWI